MTSKIIRSLRWNISIRNKFYSTFTASKNQVLYSSQSNVDKSDVERHSKFKNEWWDPNGPMKALHSMNMLRVPLIRDGLVQCSPQERSTTPLIHKKILDVGCGGGILSEPLAALGAEVTGVDASKELVQVAEQHAACNPKLECNRPQYINTSIENHAKEFKNYYDGLVASEIIEHVDDKESFLKSCILTLKPGGRMFITTPNRTRMTQIFGICVAEYILKIIPAGTHQYDKLTTPNEVTFLLERNNCQVEAIYGMFYNVLTNKWQWTKTQMFLFALQAIKLSH